MEKRCMTIRIEPHHRVNILPNVGAAEKEDSLILMVELENIQAETISSAGIVAVAYGADGTLCAVEESGAFLTLHEGERKAVKLRMDVDPSTVDSLRLYAESEFDDEDPWAGNSELADPPTYMMEYFRKRTEKP